GLMNMIEGEIQTTQRIILVDDIINSGNSFWRQIEVLEELGFKVEEVWAILRFRNFEQYKRFENRGITVSSLFCLDDFSESLGPSISNMGIVDMQTPTKVFSSQWVFKSAKPSYNWVVNKSQPVIDEDKIYFGTDNETFWALNQHDGSVIWKHTVGSAVHKKSIFSNPALHGELVIFGSYDGNVYALNKNTGMQKWVSFEADWVGSSPTVASELNLVFIGLEYGLFQKHGGIVALNADTGKTVWCDSSHPAYTHSSPLYIEKHKQVVIGSNDGVVRMYGAENGDKIWEFTTFGGASYDTKTDSGFGEGDIKESLVYDATHDYLIFGSLDCFLYILDRKTGHLVHHYKCNFGIWSTPFLYNKCVYFASLDKSVRALDLDTFKLLFEKNIDSTRIFSSPMIINDLLYIGTNAGRLHELDPKTGEKLSSFQTRERITNHVVYNAKTDTYFLPTYANEIIALTKNRISNAGAPNQ
ncbi:MAG: outer membrane protein assembly factor BamB, partial [Candidatus Azotimanducaceae bacterium]